ncbi:ROK family protein [Yinghuangia sp. ASG 101]|uniref:ROK family protein n=1 Tax=Yinghuangia sp. ASG 101 TaxID=2896848 RepID=UPI001E3C2F8A|nr:ROK family protein [Yinghuangia sp. ASG 101]UGQ11024.1 ROK family protein [Yinghuangia sp. ASG 101]
MSKEPPAHNAAAVAREAGTCVIALDVGGTVLKGGLITRDSTFVFADRRAAERARGPAAVSEGIIAFADDLRYVAESLGLTAEAAGVVVPGIVDAAEGTAVWSANLRWRDLPLRRLLHERLGLPVVLDHDVRAGGLAEGRIGAALDSDAFLFLALGTGISGAVIAAGRAYAGAHGRAGEIGHMVVRPNGSPCGCGARGCLEAEVSGPAVARRYAEAVPGARATAADVAELVVAGDVVASRVWQDAVSVLADGILSAQALLDTPLVVVGGGLSRAGDTLLAPLRALLAERATFHRVPDVVPAALGDNAGCHGAALLAWDAVGAAVSP